MKMRVATRIAALVAAGAPALAAPKPPPAPPPTVEAGPQNCIQWDFVRNVHGVFDSSYVQFRNRCPARVSFFWCHAQVFAPGGSPFCDSERSPFNMTTAAPGWTSRVSSSAQGRLVIAIRECPNGYTANLKTGGRFYCRI